MGKTGRPSLSGSGTRLQQELQANPQISLVLHRINLESRASETMIGGLAIGGAAAYALQLGGPLGVFLPVVFMGMVVALVSCITYAVAFIRTNLAFRQAETEPAPTILAHPSSLSPSRWYWWGESDVGGRTVALMLALL